MCSAVATIFRLAARKEERFPILRSLWSGKGDRDVGCVGSRDRKFMSGRKSDSKGRRKGVSL